MYLQYCAVASRWHVLIGCTRLVTQRGQSGNPYVHTVKQTEREARVDPAYGASPLGRGNLFCSRGCPATMRESTVRERDEGREASSGLLWKAVIIWYVHVSVSTICIYVINHSIRFLKLKQCVNDHVKMPIHDKSTGFSAEYAATAL